MHEPPKIPIASCGDGLLSQGIAKHVLLLWKYAQKTLLNIVLGPSKLLPAAYNRAFDASDRLVCEVDPKALLESSRGILKAGQYPKGDSLKNHVDPRTYNYLRGVFRLLRVPEAKFARYRPWFLSLMLQA